jgi:hypothetical protein
MGIQFTRLPLIIQVLEALNPPLKILPEIDRQGRFGNVAQSSAILVRQALAFQIQDFHFLLNFRVGVMVPFVLQLFNPLLSKFNLNHPNRPLVLVKWKTSSYR